MTGIVAYILSKKGAKIYTDEKFSSITGGFNYKGSVASIDDLPSDAEKGDEYTLTDDSGTYVFDGDGWYPAGVRGKQGPIGPVGPEGTAGRDGAIQYTAGTGIEITQDNIINSTSDLWESGTGEHSAQTKGNNNNALGQSSVAEGAETDAHSYASHTEGYMTSTGVNADYSHAEGYKTTTQGQASHAEGDNTITNNPAEHAEGKYNKSNMGGTAATNTISSIGIGNASSSIPGGERKNAVEVMQNGDTYVISIGSYDGTNINNASTLQSVLNSKQPTLVSGTNIKTINNENILGSGNLQVSGLPSYTSADNDKFLRVINGVAVWNAVSQAENLSF